MSDSIPSNQQLVAELRKWDESPNGPAWIAEAAAQAIERLSAELAVMTRDRDGYKKALTIAQKGALELIPKLEAECERLSAELQVARSEEGVKRAAAIGKSAYQALEAERERLEQHNHSLVQNLAAAIEDTGRLRAALERIAKARYEGANCELLPVRRIAEEALSVGHSHTESNQNDGYSQRRDALKGISAQHASEGIPDETSAAHAHEWEYILLRPGKLGAEYMDICKCGMYRIRTAENGEGSRG